MKRTNKFKSMFGCSLILGLAFPMTGGCKFLSGKKDQSNTQQAWDAVNNPANILPNNKMLERRFDKLKMAAESVSNVRPWSDSYWPNHRGGLAWRWNASPSPDFKTYPLPSKEQVAKMSLKERLALSPAEKYDILTGNWNYPLVDYERKRNNPTDEKWRGLCNGWAAASANFKEPRPVVVKSPEGIDVPFGASDVKALLALYMAQFADGGVRLVGARCNTQAKAGWETTGDTGFPQGLSECQDVNAGSFHLLLTNYIGEWSKPLVGDLVNGAEVWNYPIYEYKSYILGEQPPTAGKAAPGTVREIKLQTDVRIKIELDPPNLQNFTETNQHDVGDYRLSYQYVLELNANGEIIGGEWISPLHPDFMWTQPAPSEFKLYFGKLGELYEASMKSNPATNLLSLR
ncbi:MAG: hypothetical protein EBR09_12865 [Proteobacteria bacterium]|nr:hypothetical protein [Pseudomonadota bacterium]